MSTLASVVSLRVKPKRASDPSFNIGGIIDSINTTVASLGAVTQPYEARSALYPLLSEAETDGTGAPTGRLLFDSSKIRQVLTPVSAFILANEAMAADLDQAILRRQIQFLTRNQILPETQALLQATYPAKVTMLKELLTAATEHFRSLDAAYNPPGGPSAGVSQPRVVMATRLAGISSRQTTTTTITEGTTVKQTHQSDGASYMKKLEPGGWVDHTDRNPTLLSQETTSVSESEELRHPNLENKIRNKRLHADLLTEILDESAFAALVPNIPRIVGIELAMIDLDIRRLQIQFAETFLFPRLAGRIAAVMKDVGDNVRAGEPVLRIDSDSHVLICGQVKCRGPIRIGQSCTIETKDLFVSSPAVQLKLTGRVVAVRGYENENDKWTITVEAQNPADPRLPLGYDFEPDEDFTTITFA